jgi:endonuclease YncB( thermonuclease family)
VNRFLCALWGLLLIAGAPAMAAMMSGVVIVVIDGDTVLFKPDHYGTASRAFLKIRLADIDAPEKDQPYGAAAARELSALLLNRRATVETVATDVYGRSVARIQTDTLQINTELVRRGLAWAPSRKRPELKALQQEARLARRGLWQDAGPVPPWTWRRQYSAVTD